MVKLLEKLKNEEKQKGKLVAENIEVMGCQEMFL